ncbi:MAG: hypothetical protein QM817_42305 [Archangium sp.]
MKSTWHWLLVIVSWLAALGLSGAALILASMFRGSVSGEDRGIGLIIGAVALLWLALPAAGTWFIRGERTGLGIGLLVTSLALSVLAVGLVFGAIEAAARP